MTAAAAAISTSATSNDHLGGKSVLPAESLVRRLDKYRQLITAYNRILIPLVL
jgi:hypothetical protein